MRIGIYGGSFDPIHLGHLLVAETVRDTLGLDQVRFVPAAQSPLKQDKPPTAAKNRIEMVQLAVGGNPQFVVDGREIGRGGVSYTVDTLTEIASENPAAQLYFIMGADSLVDFSKWHEPKRICELATLIVVSRGGHGDPDWKHLAPYVDESQMSAIQSSAVKMAQIEISSRDIRSRVSRGHSIRYQVPAGVAAYITEQQMYRS